MNNYLVYLSLVSTGAVTAVSCSNNDTPKQKPNIIYIMADDLGYGDTGCYGADKIKTPNIDKFATEGRRFTDAHSASAVSTPSRYSLLTGEYSFRKINPAKPDTKVVFGPLNPQNPLIVDVNNLTLPNMLQKQGYQTACIGKWHLGFTDGEPDWNESLSPGPNAVGFDYYFGVPIVNSAPPYVWVENDTVVGRDPNDPITYVGIKGENKTPIEEFPNKGVNRYSGGSYAHSIYEDEGAGEILLGKALNWLDKAKEQDDPFFLYFATTHIHHPFTPSDRFKGSSEAGIYGDYAQELDWMIGEVLSYLDKNGLRENTIVVVTSDNGAMINEGGQQAWEHGHRINGDLLGYKFGVWEGGHRIPFIVRWPGIVEPGTVSDCVISNVDMIATFADIVDYKLQPGDAVDSFNVLESWTGEPSEPIRDYFVMTPFKPTHIGLRMGEWIYIPKQGAGGFAMPKWGQNSLSNEAAIGHTGQVNSDFVDGKLREDAPEAQLYNLKTDPYQTTNVISENSEIADMLSAKLTEIKESSHTRPY